VFDGVAEEITLKLVTALQSQELQTVIETPADPK